MPKPHIDYDAARRYVLVMMYDAYIRDEPMAFGVRRVQKALDIPKNLATVTLEALEDSGLASEIRTQQTRTSGLLNERTYQEWVSTGEYELTQQGRHHVEQLTDEAYDLCLAALANGTASSKVFDALPVAGASKQPDHWEPLPVEPGNPKLAAVRSALTDVVSLVEKDNGYSAEHANERAEVLSALSAAQTMFDHAGQFGYSAFVSYLVWPTERLMARFSPETIIGAAVGVLWAALKDWAKAKIGLALDDVFKLPK